MFSIGRSEGESPSVTQLEIMTKDSMQRALTVKTSLCQMQQGSESPRWEHGEKYDMVKLMSWKNDLMTASRMDLNRPSQDLSWPKRRQHLKEMRSLVKLLSVLIASTDVTFETLRTESLTRQRQGRKSFKREFSSPKSLKKSVAYSRAGFRTAEWQHRALLAGLSIAWETAYFCSSVNLV